jgi:hypothetical protein
MDERATSLTATGRWIVEARVCTGTDYSTFTQMR